MVWCVVEGESEKSYLTQLVHQRYRKRIVIRCETPRGKSVKNLVKKAREIERRERGNAHSIWIVCDVDENRQHGHDSEAKRWLSATAKRNAPLHRIALSHPCLEYWFLLHYDRSPGADRADSAVSELSQHCASPDGYRKGQLPPGLIEHTDNAVIRSLARVAREDEAGRHDMWARERCTTMHELIEYLDEVAKLQTDFVS